MKHLLCITFAVALTQTGIAAATQTAKAESDKDAKSGSKPAPGLMVKGDLVDSEGKPLHRWYVQVVECSEDGTYNRLGVKEQIDEKGEKYLAQGPKGTTNTDGHFQIVVPKDYFEPGEKVRFVLRGGRTPDYDAYYQLFVDRRTGAFISFELPRSQKILDVTEATGGPIIVVETN